MPNINRRILIGAIFIIFGIIFLLDNIFLFPFNLHHIFFSFPTFMIIIGIVLLLKCKNCLAGYIILGIGIITLLQRTMPFTFHVHYSYLWPLIIIIIGLMILLRRRDYSDNFKNIKSEDASNINLDYDYKYDLLDETSIFYVSKKIITSQNFKGGRITSFFGGSKIDFSKAKLAEGNNILDLAVIFGSVQFNVPANWKVVINVTTIFGGFDDKRYIQVPQAELTEGTLVITGFILFGGGKLENSLVN
ncbi:LiaI-LiaF-like domain-containing protein [Melioribacteraceae bacterium 4301-Me]|uniref:LiaF transmembrane domain-containing protein n=1 Tax=Pyranulibacter aquaticus TaxID=3163344 RepID=UPI003597B443